MVAQRLGVIVKTPQQLQKIASVASERNAEFAKLHGIEKMNHHPYATILIQNVSNFALYLSTWCPSTNKVMKLAPHLQHGVLNKFDMDMSDAECVQAANYIKGNGRPALTLLIKLAFAATVMKTPVAEMQAVMMADLISVGVPGDCNSAKGKPWPGPTKKLYTLSARCEIRAWISDPFSVVVAIDGMMGGLLVSEARKLKLTVNPFSDGLLDSYGISRHQIDLSARGGQVLYCIRAHFVSRIPLSTHTIY